MIWMVNTLIPIIHSFYIHYMLNCVTVHDISSYSQQIEDNHGKNVTKCIHWTLYNKLNDNVHQYCIVHFAEVYMLRFINIFSKHA